MARGSLYGALVLVIGGMVAGAALLNQPQPPETPLIPVVTIPTVVIPTVILPTVQLGIASPTLALVEPTATVFIPPTATITETPVPTVTAEPVVIAVAPPTSTFIVMDSSEFGEVMTFNPVKTFYAGANGARLRTCPTRTCDAASSLVAGEKFIANGAIDGEEVNPGNKLWYRTQIGEQVLYGYSGIMDTAPATSSATSPIGPSVSQPTQPLISGGSCGSLSKTCGEMNSCEEARSCLAAGNGSLDQDKDGIPCESICGG